MKVGDLVKWTWRVGSSDWESTEFRGLVVNTILAKTDYEKLRVFVVATDDGNILDVREDEPSLEVVA